MYLSSRSMYLLHGCGEQKNRVKDADDCATEQPGSGTWRSVSPEFQNELLSEVVDFLARRCTMPV